MAVSSSGHLLGVCLNGIVTREKDGNSKDINQCSNPKFKKILQFLSTVTKRADVFGHFPNAEQILDIVILSVDESCRGQGICKALVEKTRYLPCKIIILELLFSITKSVVFPYGCGCYKTGRLSASAILDSVLFKMYGDLPVTNTRILVNF